MMERKGNKAYCPVWQRWASGCAKKKEKKKERKNHSARFHSSPFQGNILVSNPEWIVPGMENLAVSSAKFHSSGIRRNLQE